MLRISSLGSDEGHCGTSWRLVGFPGVHQPNQDIYTGGPSNTTEDVSLATSIASRVHSKQEAIT